MSDGSPTAARRCEECFFRSSGLLGFEGLLKQLTGALVERALQAELTHHLGYDQHAAEGRGSGNSRNGCGAKTLQTEQGPIAIEVPRDRNGTFEPQLVKKHQRGFEGFDDKILGMYARGMSVRDIQAQLSELYGTEVSPDLISSVTDEVCAEVQAWQSRPLDAIWPIVYLDARVIKVRDQGIVGNKSAYLAMGIDIDGKKHILGLWLEAHEGAKFWLKVITELKNRGVQDISSSRAATASKAHQVQGTLPERRSRLQAALSRASQCPEEVADGTQNMEECDESISHPIRRTTARVTLNKPLTRKS